MWVLIWILQSLKLRLWCSDIARNNIYIYHRWMFYDGENLKRLLEDWNACKAECSFPLCSLCVTLYTVRHRELNKTCVCGVISNDPKNLSCCWVTVRTVYSRGRRTSIEIIVSGISCGRTVNVRGTVADYRQCININRGSCRNLFRLNIYALSSF